MSSPPLADVKAITLADPANASVTFSEEHLEAFSGFSYDVNPLHQCADYARRTPFGDRVVFGVASLLTILGRWAQGRSFRLLTLEAQFRKPLFIGREYGLELQEGPDSVTALLVAGDTLQTRLVFTAEFETVRPWQAVKEEEAFVPLQSADAPDVAAIRPNLLFAIASNRYRPDPVRLVRDLPLFGLTENQIPFDQISALLWSSYVVGMQIPGKQALFSELSFQFRKDEHSAVEGFQADDFEGRFDPRFNRIKLKGRGNGVESFKITAFHRPPHLEYPAIALSRTFKPVSGYKGKSAFVSGASRGFGAVIASGLALQGLDVTVNYLHSQSDAEAVQQFMQRNEARVHLAHGDVGNREDCERMASQIQQEQGRLDFLIHNAFPAIRAHSFLEQGSDEFIRFVTRAISGVSSLSHAFLPIMAEGGRVIVISSSYVTTPQPLFSHYGAAKSAVEGLVRVLALEHPALHFLIARLPRMLTDQTNAPFQTEKVASAVDVAAFLLEKLRSVPVNPGVGEVNI